MLSVLEIIKKTTDFLAGKRVENPRLSAETLVGHALGLRRMQLYVQFERLLSEAELEKIRPLVRRRAAREPLQYILGETEFCGLTLKCDRRALIPRPETEYLIELIQQRFAPTGPARVLDLGTGTGAVALGLARTLPTVEVVAVDASPEALALARENTERAGLSERVRLIESDWFGSIEPGLTFDLIVSNPPYLTTQEVAETQPEVREFEPQRALGSGADGLNDLRRIIDGAPSWLTSGGLLALETGIGHHAALAELAKKTGWAGFESKPDLTGRDRYVFLRRTLPAVVVGGGLVEPAG
ncbi:MAG: peptide chain release factor N(5)-glutamine methyltransferase [Opitutaceae bacterium]